MDIDEKRERVLLYLYGELPPSEAESFRAESERDPLLRQLLDEEERLQRRHPVGQSPEVSDEFLQENRLLLRAALRRTSAPSFLSRLAAHLQRVPTPLLRTAGAVLPLVVGLFLGRLSLEREDAAALIGPDDLEIVDLHVAPADPTSGRLVLTFDAVASVQIEGTLQDQAIQTVLAAVLSSDVDHSARLQSVALMRQQANSERIRQALAHALLHDANPQVRLQAVETLSGLATDDQVREALLRALGRDHNPGVRIKAIQALEGFGDPSTIEVLEDRKQNDANLYIRAEAQRLLKAENLRTILQSVFASIGLYGATGYVLEIIFSQS